jgi:hypothetical protein
MNTYIMPRCVIRQIEGGSPLATSETIGQAGDNQPLGAKGNTPIFDTSSDRWTKDGIWPSGDE